MTALPTTDTRIGRRWALRQMLSSPDGSDVFDSFFIVIHYVAEKSPAVMLDRLQDSQMLPEIRHEESPSFLLHLVSLGR